MNLGSVAGGSAELLDRGVHAELLKSGKGGLDHGEMVVGAERLRQHVMDTSSFQNSTHSPTSNQTGSGCGGAEQNLTTIRVPEGLVWDGVVFDLHLNHVLAGAFGALANRFGDFVGLAEVDANLTFAVTHNHEGREAETTAAFDDLGTAVNKNHLFKKFRTVVL